MSPMDELISRKAVNLFNEMVDHSSDKASLEACLAGDTIEDGIKIKISIEFSPLTEKDIREMKEIADGTRPLSSTHVIEEEDVDAWGDA